MMQSARRYFVLFFGLVAGLVVVFTLETLAADPVEVSPAALRLLTTTGSRLAPVNVALDYAVAPFRRQTIEPDHGTSGHAVFALDAVAEPAELQYATVAVPLVISDLP